MKVISKEKLIPKPKQEIIQATIDEGIPEFEAEDEDEVEYIEFQGDDGDWPMRSKKCPVDIFREGTEAPAEASTDYSWNSNLFIHKYTNFIGVAKQKMSSGHF